MCGIPSCVTQTIPLLLVSEMFIGFRLANPISNAIETRLRMAKQISEDPTNNSQIAFVPGSDKEGLKLIFM